VPLFEGDLDWPAVMQALRDIKYAGWGAAEIAGGDEKYLARVAKGMDEIFAL
jgi:hexulose-6-phosphate isomerase